MEKFGASVYPCVVELLNLNDQQDDVLSIKATPAILSIKALCLKCYCFYSNKL